MKTLLSLSLILLVFGGCHSNDQWTATDPISSEEIEALRESYRIEGLLVTEEVYDEIWTSSESSQELFDRFAALPSGINSVSERDLRSVLQHFAARSSVEDIKDLLDRGARVDLRNQYGSTALHSAAVGRNVEIAKILIAAGADVNATDEYGETPLFTACSSAPKQGTSQFVQLLISHGADYKIYLPSSVHTVGFPRTPYGWLEKSWEEEQDKEAKLILDSWQAPPHLPNH